MFKIGKRIRQISKKSRISSSLIRGSLISGLALLFTFFTACSSDDDYHYIGPENISGFMAINLITDQPSVGVSLSGNRVGWPLPYRSYTGSYLSIYPGKRSTDSYSGNNGNTLASATYTYDPENYYSLFMIGKDGNYENVVVKDGLDTLQAESNTAYIRYFNAIPDQDAPEVEMTKDSVNLYSGTATYGEASPFMTTQTGEVSVGIKNGQKIDTSRTLHLQNGKVYTLLFTGDPEVENGTESVQIRYIENGIITKDSISQGDSQKTE